MVKSTTVTTYGDIPTIPQKKGATAKVDKSYGLTFPIGKNLKGGYFSKESGVELIKNNLSQLIKTQSGERAMSNFGMDLRKYLFEPLDRVTMDGITREVTTQVSKYHPNLDILKLSVRPLNKYGSEGYPGLQIMLVVKLKDLANSIFDVKADII